MFLQIAITSPIGVPPKPKSRRSTGPCKVRGARTQADVKLKPQSTGTGSTVQRPMPKPVGQASQTGTVVKRLVVAVRLIRTFRDLAKTEIVQLLNKSQSEQLWNRLMMLPESIENSTGFGTIFFCFDDLKLNHVVFMLFLCLRL